MAGPGSGTGGKAVKRFKKKPRTTIERLLGETDRPSDPVNPEPARNSPSPEPEKTPAPVSAGDAKKDEETKPQPIIPPDAVRLNQDGSEVGTDTTNLTRADRQVLDLFMPKRDDRRPAPPSDAQPTVSEADAFRMLGLSAGGVPAVPGAVSIPSGPMPEHAPSPDGAERLLEVMHRFTKR